MKCIKYWLKCNEIRNAIWNKNALGIFRVNFRGIPISVNFPLSNLSFDTIFNHKYRYILYDHHEKAHGQNCLKLSGEVIFFFYTILLYFIFAPSGVKPSVSMTTEFGPWVVSCRVGHNHWSRTSSYGLAETDCCFEGN